MSEKSVDEIRKPGGKVKRVGNIYEKITKKENIRKAIINASKGKKDRNGVVKILDNVNFYVDEIYFYFIYFLLTFAKIFFTKEVFMLVTMKEILDQAKKDNYGVTSIMVDRSSLSYEDNIAQTKETVKMCRPLNISVEAELGHVGQSEDYSSDGSDHFTKPEEVKKFVEETGIDCLAVAIGTAHGRYHGTPHIDFNLLKQITDVVDIPLVLHGGSGTGDENLRKAVKNGIQKVNLATELVVAGKEELETFIQDKNFDKWQLIPSFIKGYSDRLEHYVKLFDQENRAW